MSVHVASTYELDHDLFFLWREQFSIAPKNGGKTQSDVVRAFAYLLMKTLSDPYNTLGKLRLSAFCMCY